MLVTTDKAKRQKECESAANGICPYCHHEGFKAVKTVFWIAYGEKHYKDIYLCNNCMTEWISNIYEE